MIWFAAGRRRHDICMRQLPMLCFGLVSACLQLTARDLVRIPGKAYDPVDERTGVKVHVRIDSFDISPTETTQAEFESIMGFNPSQYRGADLPVQNVSWWDAIRYCNLRSLREGLHPSYDLSSGRCDHHSNGYRLPTESEWVLAAALDSNASAEGLKQAATLGTPDTKSIEELMQSVRAGPTPVASHGPNRLGLYDMLGNVWEWCQDFYDAVTWYPQADNPDGPDWGIARVIRGGRLRPPPQPGQKAIALHVNQISRADSQAFAFAERRPPLLTRSLLKEIEIGWSHTTILLRGSRPQQAVFPRF